MRRKIEQMVEKERQIYSKEDRLLKLISEQRKVIVIYY